MPLMNYTIGYLWKEGNEGLSLISQAPFVPCKCKQRHFYLKGLLHVIQHKGGNLVMVKYRCGKRTSTKNCSKERMSLSKLGSYCRECVNK